MRKTPLLFWILIAVTSVAAESQRVSLRQFAPQSTVCSAAGELTVELVVKNVSSASLEVDANALGHGFDAIALYDTVSNVPRFETLQIVGDRITEPTRRLVMLLPGDTYVERRDIVLDPSFFSQPGFYKIRTGYFERAGAAQSGGPPRRSFHVMSNWVIVQVNSCAEGESRALGHDLLRKVEN